METENPIGMRLKSVKPDKIVPNFIQWLSQAGKVEFGKSIVQGEKEGRWGLLAGGAHRGIRVSVILNRNHIGYLECYLNPAAVAYDGERPNIPLPRKRGGETPSPEMRLFYLWDHPLAHRSNIGRGDGWDIPFP